MSLPPLPDIFGNYTLGEDFVEVVDPGVIDWLPQTAGWAWLAVGAGLWLVRALWRRARRWYRNRYRREAAARLARLAQSPEDGGWLVELNRLLKITAIAAYGRERVARLWGRDWVDFLNLQCPAPPFREDHCRVLAQAVYTGATPDAGARQALADAAQRWVREHRGAHDV